MRSPSHTRRSPRPGGGAPGGFAKGKVKIMSIPNECVAAPHGPCPCLSGGREGPAPTGRALPSRPLDE